MPVNDISDNTISKWLSVAVWFVVPLFAVTMCGALGTLTHIINISINKIYFLHFLRGEQGNMVFLLSANEGAKTGVIYGMLFSAIFMGTLWWLSKTLCSLTFACRYLFTGVFFLLECWCLGGLIAVGLAMLLPEFYYDYFSNVPQHFHEMLKYAWIGGSVWGLRIGALLTIVIIPMQAVNDRKLEINTTKNIAYNE